jgi:hypothetical protein
MHMNPATRYRLPGLMDVSNADKVSPLMCSWSRSSGFFTIDPRVGSLPNSGRVSHALCILSCVCWEGGFGKSDQLKSGLVPALIF